MKNRVIIFFVIFLLLFIPVSSVAASEDFQPPNPGVGSLQDASIQETLNWLIKPPIAIKSPIFNAAESLNRSCLDPIALKTGSSGNLLFTGFDASLTSLNSIKPAAFSSFEPFVFGKTYPPPPSDNCDSTTTPGIISLVASLTSPTNPVVVAQDPNRTGVNLIWTLNILPTVYTYGIWQRLCEPLGVHCQNDGAECQINESGHPCFVGSTCEPNNDSSGNGKCRPTAGGPVYDCVDYTTLYKEDYATLTPKATLTLSSRSWILSELARAYPGAFLKHPDWGFTATEPCVWVNNVCVWTHTEGGVQTADPGWYDLQVTGTTAGTDITDPRDFTLTGGQFGVYLVETTKTGHQ